MNSLLPLNKCVTAVIWDWNGTIVDDIDLTLESLNSTMMDYLSSPVTIDVYKERFRFPVRDFYTEIGVQVTDQVFLELCDKFLNYYHSNLSKCRPHSWSLEAIKEIHNQGLPQYILSAMEHTQLNEMVKHFELAKYFTKIQGISNIAGGSKLSTGISLTQSLEHPTSNLLYVGDTDHDFEVADEIGIPNICLVEHGHQAHQRLKKLLRTSSHLILKGSLG